MEAGIARMRDNNLAETVVGAVVVAIAVLFIAFIYTRTGSGGLSGYEIQARLNKVDGMAVGTDVRLAGVKIGSVSDLTLDPRTYLVTVHMAIRNDVKIPNDSSLQVTAAGLLGSPYISITPGGDDKVLASGGTIENAQGSVNMMDLINRFISTPPPPAKPQQQAKPQQNPGPSP
jgi:phospholipid/cholesterol/gamma-HCH transport system substrate-binding protein